MTKFLTGLIVAALSNPEVQKAIKNILGAIITERIVPLIPVAAAAAVDAAVKQFPGIPDIADVTHVAEETRNVLNDLIPDIDLPFIGDLTDFWRPKN